MSSGANRIVVDWDGTCVPLEDPWVSCSPTEWLPGAVGALLSLCEAGYEVVIMSTRLAPREMDEETMRTKEEKKAEVRYIRKMLDDAGLKQVGIWRRSWKPGALAYIDDKAVRFRQHAGGWTRALEEVLG